MGERPESTRGFAAALARSFPGAIVALAALAAAAFALSACGGDDSTNRQDADEPSGDFPVEVTEARFPTKQRLAQTSMLRMGVENTGDETMPQLAFTIETNDGVADGSFSVQIHDEGVSNPNRPVWILESKYPRVVGEPIPKGLGAGLRAQTNTYAFGPLDPGEEMTVLWKLTAVQAGDYDLHYRVQAGLYGNARAVTEEGDPVEGKFAVKINPKAPQATVNGKGQVVTQGE